MSSSARLHPNNCPRVFLNKPQGLRSGKVWVMRIGMPGKSGNNPMIPPVA